MTERKVQTKLEEFERQYAVLYVNPNFRPGQYQIDSRIVKRLQATGKLEVADPMDAMQLVANCVEQHVPRLTGILAQGAYVALSEALVEKPLKTTWHIVLYHDTAYVSDMEILPYI